MNPRFFAATALVALAACSSGPAKTWEYRAGVGFVNLSTREQVSPENLLGQGERQFKEKHYKRAAEMVAPMIDAPIENSFREKALFLRARAIAEDRDPYHAWQEFDKFTRLFPESDYVIPARECMMLTALNLVKVGYTDFLGVFKTSKVGLEWMRATLLRFPREDFTDNYYLKLAQYFIDNGNLDEAELELKFIIDQYANTESAPRALLMLAQVGLKRFDSISYDVKTLGDAKRYYERFLGDYPRFADDPARLKTLELDGEKLAAMTKEAADGIRFIKERLADKELTMAKFYIGNGRSRAAKLYLRGILNDYPESAAASESLKLLESLRAE